jgi:hypothetical protein
VDFYIQDHVLFLFLKLVFFDNSVVIIEISADNIDANYSPAGEDSVFMAPGAAGINAQGDYYLRARLSEAKGKTNVTVVSNQ